MNNQIVVITKADRQLGRLSQLMAYMLLKFMYLDK